MQAWTPGNLDAQVIVSPENVTQVAQLVQYCGDNQISIVPHGGRTGLCGAAQSNPGQVIIQTAKLNQIIEVDPVTGIAVVEAGVTLEKLQDAICDHGFSTGIDLAARGSATVGGLLSTNAGGTQAFRHGITRHRVLGLQAVLPNGQILNDMKHVIKANEGYDIKHLLMGAEGTLGIITKVVLNLVPVDKHRSTALISCNNALSAITMLREFQQNNTCELLSAEIMWPEYARTTAEALGFSNLLDFTPSDTDVLVIIDISAMDQQSSTAVLEQCLADFFDENIISSALIAQNERESINFWKIREESFECDKKYPHGHWYDVSVPLRHLDAYCSTVFSRINQINPQLKVFLFGHLGDGNLHVTITSGQKHPELAEKIDCAVFDGLNEIGGSFSAEHGIGKQKISTLVRYSDPQKLLLMQAIKNTIDPLGIMNPGKVLE